MIHPTKIISALHQLNCIRSTGYHSRNELLERLPGVSKYQLKKTLKFMLERGDLELEDDGLGVQLPFEVKWSFVAEPNYDGLTLPPEGHLSEEPSAGRIMPLSPTKFDDQMLPAAEGSFREG